MKLSFGTLRQGTTLLGYKGVRLQELWGSQSTRNTYFQKEELPKLLQRVQNPKAEDCLNRTLQDTFWEAAREELKEILLLLSKCELSMSYPQVTSHVP